MPFSAMLNGIFHDHWWLEPLAHLTQIKAWSMQKGHDGHHRYV